MQVEPFLWETLKRVVKLQRLKWEARRSAGRRKSALGQFVIVAYRPRPGKEGRLLELVRDHLPILRREGLATDRRPYVMRAGDGTIVEVFEWKSQEAVERAHENEVVKKMWEEFEEACEYESLANLPESQQLFSPFEPIDLSGEGGT